jgi:Flp pilus assembly protein TadG
MWPRLSRRGSNAIEFALILPVLLILVAGVVDLGQLLYLADATVAAVAEGARAGALADPDDGEIPTAVADVAATQWWTAAEIPASFAVASQVTGAAPDAVLEVRGTVTFNAAFGLIDLPASASYTQTIRLFHQP